MNELDEALQLALPPRLTSIRPAVKRVLAWCRIHGVDAKKLSGIELPLVEAVNNAIEHGCAGNPETTVQLSVRVASDHVVVTVCDPGNFQPPANWAELPEDPLAEGGRGGFIIDSNTDGWEHSNTDGGHTLTLRWNVERQPGMSIESAADAENDMGRLTEDLANSFETLLCLTHFTGLLATSSTFDQLLAQVRERLETMLLHDSLFVRFTVGDTLQLHALGLDIGLPAELPLSGDFAESVCVRDGRPLVGGVDRLPDGDPLAAMANTCHLCVLPVEFGGKTLGTLVVVRGAQRQSFSGGEVELLQAVADFVGIAKATDNLWQERNQQLRLEQEIKVASGIQRSLLPDVFPPPERWWVHGECRPAREVGGDYFDVVTLHDGTLMVLVADVMGKGVPAALLAAMLRSSLRALSAVESSPSVILSDLNRQLFPDLVRLGMFITAILVILPPTPGALPSFSNAGHCAPAILRPDGRFIEPSGGNVPLGILPDTQYEALPLPMDTGDRLVLYTDGCYELPGPDGELMLGPEIYLKFAVSRFELNPPEFIAALLDPIALKLDPATIADDRTVLVASLCR